MSDLSTEIKSNLNYIAALLIFASCVLTDAPVYADSDSVAKAQFQLIYVTGDDPRTFPPEDMKIRQMLKEQLNGRKDVEYEAVFLGADKSRPVRGVAIGAMPLRIPNSLFYRNSRLMRESTRNTSVFMPLSQFVSKPLRPYAETIEHDKDLEAKDGLKSIQATTPEEFAELYYLRGLLLQAAGEYKEARKQFELARKNSSNKFLKDKADLGIERAARKRDLDDRQLRFPRWAKAQ